jgi:hypothetical protein
MIRGYLMVTTTNRKPPPKSPGGKKGPRAHVPLNAADRLFIEEYLRSGSATAAYHCAGFNGNNPGANGSKMLHKASIQRFLKRAENKAVKVAAGKLEITVDKVLGDIETARMAALGALPAPQCAAAIKASELHGRHIGMFRDDWGEREQLPMISITTGDGTKIAMMSAKHAALLPSISTQPLPGVIMTLPDGVDEVLTDDDFL